MPPLPASPASMAGTWRSSRQRGALAVGQKVYVTARELPVRAGATPNIAVPERALFAAAAADLRQRRACPTIRSPGICCTPRPRRRGKACWFGSASGGLGSAAVPARQARRHDGDRPGRNGREGPRAQGVRRRSRHRPQPRGCAARSPRSPRRRRRSHPRRGRRQGLAKPPCSGRSAAGVLRQARGKIEANVVDAPTLGRAISTAPPSASSPCTRDDKPADPRRR